MVGKLYKSDNTNDIVIIEREGHEGFPDQPTLLRFLDDRHIQHDQCTIYIHFTDTDEYYVKWSDGSFIQIPKIPKINLCKCTDKCTDVSDDLTIETILTTLKCINMYVNEVRKLNNNQPSTIDSNLTFNQFTETIYCMLSGLILQLKDT